MSARNTAEDNSLSRFNLKFESPVSAEEEIAEALEHNTVRMYRKLVLQINKIGLLPLMRFTKRS